MIDLTKTTIVSLVPFELREKKPCYPSEYIIPAAKWGDISTLIVGTAHHFVYVNADTGSIKVPLMADELAKSIVNDFSVACLAQSKDVGPGIFTLPGDYTPQGIKKEFPDRINDNRKRQIGWFMALVAMADDDWHRNHQHKMISDLQRAACKYLELTKPWLEIVPELETRCPACLTVVDKRAIVCAKCNCILDSERYKDVSFARAIA